MEAGDALPPFPTVVADTLRRTGQALESEPLIRGQIDQSGTTTGVIENRQASGIRGATSAGLVGTSRTTPSTAPATPTATSTPSCEGEGEPAPRGRRGQPRGPGRGLRAANAERGDGTSRRRYPRPGCSEPLSSAGGQGGVVAETGVPGTYCGEDLIFFSGDPGESQSPVPVTCSQGGFLHARCIWDLTERLANSHVGQQPCVTCRFEWPARCRPPHPAELAQGLPKSQLGGR